MRKCVCMCLCLPVCVCVRGVSVYMWIRIDIFQIFHQTTESRTYEHPPDLCTYVIFIYI